MRAYLRDGRILCGIPAGSEAIDWGGCPECARNEAMVSLGRDHYCYCSKHRKRWFIGSNLFSSWRDQSAEEQRETWASVGLDSFEEVEPIFPVPELGEGKVPVTNLALRIVFDPELAATRAGLSRIRPPRARGEVLCFIEPSSDTGCALVVPGGVPSIEAGGTIVLWTSREHARESIHGPHLVDDAPAGHFAVVCAGRYPARARENAGLCIRETFFAPQFAFRGASDEAPPF